MKVSLSLVAVTVGVFGSGCTHTGAWAKLWVVMVLGCRRASALASDARQRGEAGHEQASDGRRWLLADCTGSLDHCWLDH